MPPHPSHPHRPGRRDNAFVKLAGVPNNAQPFAAATAYDTVEQISTIFDGTNVSLRRNNGSPIQATSSAAFNGTRIALGFAGNSTFRSPPGSYVAEWWFSPPPSAQRIARAVCRRKGLLRPAIVAIAS